MKTRTKVKRPTHKHFKKIALQDPEIRAAYETHKPEFDLIDQFIQARKKEGMSQEEFGKKAKLKQPTVARLERGGYASTSIRRLAQYADSIGRVIKISLTQKKKTKKS